jgi:myo-inositol-1(or 4)-monophosphatase
MSDDLQSDLARAEAALHEAMAVLRRHAAAGPVAYELKDGWSPVTAADREADALLRRRLPLPGDGWLSEESEDEPSRLQAHRVWIVDPLDGTRSFIAGRADYSVSIALVCDGRPVLGAIGCPASGVTVLGTLGLGVTTQGDPRLGWEDGDGLRILASRSETKRGEWQAVAPHCRIRPVGSVAYKLALVAGGWADGTWTMHPKHEWDVAAGAALVVAAGGEVWLPRGGHLLWNRSRPRFLSFAAAAPGLRTAITGLQSGA